MRGAGGIITCFVVVVVAIIICIVMLATGYMPLNGFGHNAAHAGRYNLVTGIGLGALFGTLVR